LSGLLVLAAVLSKECAMHDSSTKHVAQLARLAMMIRIDLESAEAAIPGINDLLAELATLGLTDFQVEGPAITGSLTSCPGRGSIGTGQPEAGVAGEPNLGFGSTAQAAGAMDGPAAVKQARGVRPESQAQVRRHGA
jgi:hypothetical protein